VTTSLLTLGAVNPSGQVTGSPPQWSDGSDATYYFGDSTLSGNFNGWAPVTVPVSGTLVSIRFFIRAKTEAGFGPSPAEVSAFITDDRPGGIAGAIGELNLPHDGSIHETWLDGIIYPEDTVDILTEPDLRAECLFRTNSRIWIYEVAVEVTMADVAPPPIEAPVTRLHPRDDGRGRSSSARLAAGMPPERIIAGYY
jgi:hypothetical protein